MTPKPIKKKKKEKLHHYASVWVSFSFTKILILKKRVMDKWVALVGPTKCVVKINV